MSQEIEIIPKGGGDMPSPIEVESNQDMLVNIKAALVAKGVTSDSLASKIASLMDAKNVTNSGIQYDDNVTQLKTVELALKLWGIKGIGNAPVVAIFNNVPNKDERLQY